MELLNLKVEKVRVLELMRSSLELDNYYLPPFQRDYVWDEDDVKSMVDSMIRGYPIGSIILWAPSSEEFIKENPFSLPLADITINHGGKYYYVLDGQQRLTSLLLLFREWRITRNGEEISLKVPISIAPAPDGGYKLYKSKKRGVDLSKLLKIALNPFDSDSQNYLRKYEQEYIEKARRFASKIATYELPIYIIETQKESEETILEMAEAFIRINKEGVRIGNVELMLSLMTSVLGGKVKHAISRGIYRKIRKTFGFEVDIQPIIRFILANLGINQAQISKVDKFAKALKQISEDERIHKTDIVLEKSSEAFTLTIELIARRLPLPSSQLLPSQITLVPVARYIYLQDINELSQLSNEEERKILNWFILANFTSYYSTWTSSKLEQDLKVISSASTFPYNELLKNMKSRNYPTEITKQMILKGREENTLKRSGRNYIFLLYIALANNNADDWNGQLISSISYEELTRHHIFPKKFLEENLEVEDPERRDIEINNLGNITLINKAINSEIGDSPPQEYLPQRHRESLEKHFIPYEPELWKLENYDEFLNTRMTLLYRALKNIYPEIIK